MRKNAGKVNSETPSGVSISACRIPLLRSMETGVNSGNLGIVIG